MRAQADLALGSEDRPRERLERALQVGQRDPLIDGQALDLMELRGVRDVMVAAVHTARNDQVDRRLLQLHRTDLHRARVSAQQHVIRDIERVRPGARRVRQIMVQSVEVVMHGLDLGTVGNLVSKADEHVLDLPPRLRDQVQPTDGRQRIGRQRHVDLVLLEAGVQLGNRQVAGLGVDLGLKRLARFVRRLADGATLLGRQLSHAAQQVRELSLAAEELDADVLKLGGRAGLGDGGLCGCLKFNDFVAHTHAGVILRVSSYKATVAAIAAFSDSVTIGMRAT